MLFCLITGFALLGVLWCRQTAVGEAPRFRYKVPHFQSQQHTNHINTQTTVSTSDLINELQGLYVFQFLGVSEDLKPVLTRAWHLWALWVHQPWPEGVRQS